MATGLSSYPTHSEAQDLALLATSSTTEPFSGIEYFQELLRILRDPSISDFLLTSDPIELQHLVHPQLSLFAVTNDMYETNVEPNSNPLNSLSDHWNSRHFAFPAYSSGERTFGFLISKDTYVPGSAWGFHQGAIESLSSSRFVKHHSEGYTVYVAHYKEFEFNAYRLEYTKMITNTRQVRFIVAVDAKVFQNLCRRGSLFVKDILPALSVMQMSIEHRRCPSCSLSVEECFCPTPIVNPRHPFDHDAFRTCMMNHAGVFEGKTVMSLFGGGVKLRSGTLGSRFISRPKYDVDLVEGLRTLAISKHMGPENARHSNIFTDLARNTAQVRDYNDAVPLLETSADNVQELYCHDASQVLNHDTDAWEPDYLLPSSREEAESCEVINTDMTPALVDVFLNSCEAPESHQSIFRLSEEGIAPVLSENDNVKLSTFESPNHGQIIDKEKDDEQDLQKGEKTKPHSNTSERQSSVDDQVRRLKTELRKERNRACAQRSNMRKKAKMDALKNDLKTTREKADLLRSQEMALRKQNIFLRQQVAEIQSTERKD